MKKERRREQFSPVCLSTSCTFLINNAQLPTELYALLLRFQDREQSTGLAGATVPTRLLHSFAPSVTSERGRVTRTGNSS